MFFALFQLNRNESQCGIFAIRIRSLRCQNGLVAVFGGLILLKCVEASRGKVGGGEADAGFLRFLCCEIKLNGGRLVKIFRSEDFAEAIGPGCGELTGLELHDKLLIGSARGSRVSCHAVTLGQAKKGLITHRSGRAGNQKGLILRNRQIVEFARVKRVCATQHRFSRRTTPATGRDADILRVIQNSRRRSRLRGWRNWRGLDSRRQNSRSGRLYRLSPADLNWLSIGEAVHPRGILIIFQRWRICRQGAAHLLGLGDGSQAEQRENENPLHC